MSAKIFISFASEDRGVAMTLCSALESRGFKCWISPRDILPGENFQIAIVRAIRESKIMLLVFTANSNNSEEMSKELALASQNKLMVVPLRVEDVTPNDAFSYEFATRQWIDLFSDWEIAIHQLAQRLESAIRAMDTLAEPAPILALTAEEIAAAPPPASSSNRSVLAMLTTPTHEPVEVAASPRAAALDDEADEAKAADIIAADTVKPRRAGLYVALTLVAVIAVGVGMTAVKWLHGGKAAESRAMVVMPASPAPAQAPAAPLVPVDTAAAQPAVGAPDAVTIDKPAPRKHKSHETKPVEEVPF